VAWSTDGRIQKIQGDSLRAEAGRARYIQMMCRGLWSKGQVMVQTLH